MASSTPASVTNQLGGDLRASAVSNPGARRRSSSLWRDGARRLLRNRLAVAGGVVVVLIGVPIGALSGYIGGRTDLVLTRFVDVMYAFPRLLFVILVMSMLGAGLTNIFIAIGLTGWVGIARQTRAQVLAMKEKEFVDGARALGAGFSRVLGRHVMPNALTPIIVAVTFGIPEAIFTEAALSFIGVGINPPTPSWGQMVGEGQQYIRSYWHLCVFPSIAIAVTMLSFVFFGDGVRDALDPKLK
jgi:ABC-type dipeptide/oligopeptide/nickel transport system permease subunit